MSLNQYVELILPCTEEQKEILIAELDMEGYESVMETDEGLHGYIQKDLFDKSFVEDISSRYNIEKEKITWELVEEKNWNIEWEKNFEPVAVDDLCYIRAPFHPAKSDQYKYELIILPRMSFGTGHHATTYLMVKNQIINIDHKNKKVLDAGCGTAILAVMAEKLGASKVVAYDNNEWSVENAPENASLNNCKNIHILLGTIDSLEIDNDFDVILANINKNVLLEEIATYVDHLVTNGYLLVSGFFKEDEADIQEIAEEAGLTKETSAYKDRWASILFKK
ncbi:MAG: 50S ribosomal protein L11 methyltransferase [Candidatus Cyclobacteriaceae bacterium M2_1C_046]